MGGFLSLPGVPVLRLSLSAPLYWGVSAFLFLADAASTAAGPKGELAKSWDAGREVVDTTFEGVDCQPGHVARDGGRLAAPVGCRLVLVLCEHKRPHARGIPT